MRDLPIIALDFDSEDHVLDFLDQFDEPLCKSRNGIILSNWTSFN